MGEFGIYGGLRGYRERAGRLPATIRWVDYRTNVLIGQVEKMRIMATHGERRGEVNSVEGRGSARLVSSLYVALGSSSTLLERGAGSGFQEERIQLSRGSKGITAICWQYCR